MPIEAARWYRFITFPMYAFTYLRFLHFEKKEDENYTTKRRDTDANTDTHEKNKTYPMPTRRQLTRMHENKNT